MTDKDQDPIARQEATGELVWNDGCDALVDFIEEHGVSMVGETRDHLFNIVQHILDGQPPLNSLREPAREAEDKCSNCGGAHEAQFHVPTRVWEFIGCALDDFLCAECVHAKAIKHGVTLAWFVNDENYLNEVNWRSGDSPPPVEPLDRETLDALITSHNGENCSNFQSAYYNWLRGAESLRNAILATSPPIQGEGRSVLDEVKSERDRAEAKFPNQHIPNFPERMDWDHAAMERNQAQELTDRCHASGVVTWWHVLREEVYEAFAESHDDELRADDAG